jgi:hypothetical protein
MKRRTEWKFILTGWLLFTASALFFTWGAIGAGDWVSIIASLLFLVACFVFLVPAWKLRPPPD